MGLLTRYTTHIVCLKYRIFSHFSSARCLEFRVAVPPSFHDSCVAIHVMRNEWGLPRSVTYKLVLRMTVVIAHFIWFNESSLQITGKNYIICHLFARNDYDQLVDVCSSNSVIIIYLSTLLLLISWQQWRLAMYTLWIKNIDWSGNVAGLQLNTFVSYFYGLFPM